MKRSNFIFICVLALAVVSTAIFAGTFTSTSSGPWNAPETWGQGAGGVSSTPGNGSGGPDNATVSPGNRVNTNGPTRNPLGNVNVNGTLQGEGTNSSVAVNATGNVTVGSSGTVGGCQTGTSNNPVSITSTTGTVTVNGTVQGNGSRGRVNVQGSNGVTVGGTGFVGSAASGTSISSSGGPITVQSGGAVTGRGHTQINAGPGQPTTIDGTVSANGTPRYNVYINNRRRGRPGNVTIGATGVVSATGEVYINADTLVVKGTIKANTLQKKVKTLILYYPPGSIDIKKNFKNKIDTVYTNKEKTDPSVPSEKGSDGGVTGEDHCHIDLSSAPLAFEATNTVRIATGNFGTIDLRNNPAGTPVISCPGPIEIFADNILLDPGVFLPDIAGPGPVIFGPSQPIMDVSTLCVGDTVGYPGHSGAVEFLVTNMGNVADSFFVSVVDSLGWPFTQSDQTIFLDNMEPADSLVSINFSVPPSATLGDTNIFYLSVSSLTTGIGYTEQALVPVLDECQLRDVSVHLWHKDNSPQPASCIITSLIVNAGDVLSDTYNVTVTDREGWTLLPSGANYPLAAGDEVYHQTDVTIPGSAAPGDSNEVYILIESTECPGLGMSDTVTVVVGDVTGIGDNALIYSDIEHRCYPNPFNPDVHIQFTVPAPGGRTSIVIYDVDGRRVKTLLTREMETGRFTYPWDGRNDAGNSVASGVYIYRITAVGKRATGKMVLLR